MFVVTTPTGRRFLITNENAPKDVNDVGNWTLNGAPARNRTRRANAKCYESRLISLCDEGRQAKAL